MEVLKELAAADEPSFNHADLPHDVQCAMEELRDMRMAMVRQSSSGA